MDVVIFVPLFRSLDKLPTSIQPLAESMHPSVDVTDANFPVYATVRRKSEGSAKEKIIYKNLI